MFWKLLNWSWSLTWANASKQKSLTTASHGVFVFLLGGCSRKKDGSCNMCFFSKDCQWVCLRSLLLIWFWRELNIVWNSGCCILAWLKSPSWKGFSWSPLCINPFIGALPCFLSQCTSAMKGGLVFAAAFRGINPCLVKFTYSPRPSKTRKTWETTGQFVRWAPYK